MCPMNVAPEPLDDFMKSTKESMSELSWAFENISFFQIRVSFLFFPLVGGVPSVHHVGLGLE